MRIQIACMVAAIILSGCTDQNLEKAKSIATKRQEDLKAFHQKFDPIYARLASCVNSTDPKALAEGDGLQKEFDQLQKDSSNLAVSEKVKPVLLKCSRISGDVGMLDSLAMYGDNKPGDSLADSIKARLAEFRQTGPNFDEVDRFVSVERAKRELTTKPTPPESIKVGAKLYDGDTGKLLGVIIKTDEKFGKDTFVAVADDPAKPEDKNHLYEKYLVELGVEYRVEP